jgi:hypothetical protein
MRFRLFGGADSSDAFLAQLCIVAAMDLPQVQALTAAVASSFQAHPSASADGGNSAEEWRDGFFADAALLTAAGGEEQLAGGACAVHCLLQNIVRYDVATEAALKEMSMLGLAAPVSEAIAKAAASNHGTIRASLLRRAAMFPQVLRSAARPLRADEAESETPEAPAPAVEGEGGPDYLLQLVVEPAVIGDGPAVGATQYRLTADQATLMALLAELVEAKRSLSRTEEDAN